jgi:hypothetical protein
METFGSAKIGRSSLLKVRKDFSLPEVRNQTEWKIFLKVSKSGCVLNDSSGVWNARFCREVDMTKERPKFLSHPSKTSLPVIEGRMIQHHRFGVKGYISGTGRKAVWKAYPIGASNLHPQFWIEPENLSLSTRNRIQSLRVGFCDITGQTNERSLMASIIPPGVVCGNKVPTIIFSDDPSHDSLLVWTAIANSFVFDWMLRRILTTTVNYFLLQSIPLPILKKDGLLWKKLVTCVNKLVRLNKSGALKSTREQMAQLRSEIDAEVAVAYGLTIDELELILRDFPILDRGQPPLPGEDKSTITRDTVLSAASKRMGGTLNLWQDRVRIAHELGAQAYIPSEIASRCEKFKGYQGMMING